MRVRLQNDQPAEIFSDQLLAIGNEELQIDTISGRIQLPSELCNLVKSKNDLVGNIFPNILHMVKIKFKLF